MNLSIRRLVLHSVALALTVANAPSAFALDASIVGEWVTTFEKPDGAWEAHWSVKPDGSYHSTLRTLRGSVYLPDEDGQVKADRGAWSIKSTSNRVDGGTFELNGNDLTLNGASSKTVWHKAGTGHAVAARPEVAQPATSQPFVQKPLSAVSKAGGPTVTLVEGLLPESRYLSLTAAKPGLGGGMAAQVLIDQAMKLKDKGQFGEAAGKFSQALSADPQSINAHYQRGVCLTKMQGQTIPQTLMRAMPHSIRGSANLTHLAIGDFTHVILAQPNNAKAWCMRGVAKLELCAFNSAIADFDKALTLKPDYAAPYAYRGIAKIEMAQSPGNDLQRSYALDPTTRPIFEQMAVEAKSFSDDLIKAQQQREAAAAAAAACATDSSYDDPEGPFHMSGAARKAMEEYDRTVEERKKRDQGLY
jgi:hypothetical protein